MKKALKWMLLSILLMLVFVASLYYTMFYGNPISKLATKNTSINILKEQYSDTDYQLRSVVYNFKDGNYYAHVESQKYIDEYFSIICDGWGRYRYDTSDNIENKNNVAGRLNSEYRKYVDEKLKEFPYSSDILFGEMLFEWGIDDRKSDNAISIQELINNKHYSIEEISKTNGHIVLYVDDNFVSFDKAAEILIKLKETNVHFYSVDLVLRYPKIDQEYNRPEGEIRLQGFLFSQIYEEDLVSRVENNFNETDECYKKLDKENK